MKVLLTGSRGLLGRAVHARLEARGDEVVSFDLADGQDLLDARQILVAAEGCRAVVHLAAALPDPEVTDQRTMAVNVQGTQHVLRAAEARGARRVVFASSVNALGIFRGEAPPRYLPIDDDHPADPGTAYGISKRFGEAMCRDFTRRTGAPTLCLRLPAVWDEATKARIRRARDEDPAFEWTPWWEYGAWIDLEDAAAAFEAALVCEAAEHACLLVCADDVSSRYLTSRALVEQLLPDVPWRGGEAYDADPYRALLDTRGARRVLGWAPRRRWRPSSDVA